MSDLMEVMMSTQNATSHECCAWCEQPLPAPAETLPIVHGRAGETMTACSGECLAEMVAASTGWFEGHRQPVARRRN